MKIWSTWKKLLFWASIFFVLGISIFTFWNVANGPDMGAIMFFVLITLPIVSVIVGLWVVDFVINFLCKRKKRNWVLGILFLGFLGSIGYVIWILIAMEIPLMSALNAIFISFGIIPLIYFVTKLKNFTKNLISY